MSVLNPISILPYAGLNATGPYAITFDVFLDDGGNAKDITVLLLAGGAITDITSTSTVTGKNVYTAASYIPSDTVILLRDPLFTQPYVYSGVTQFPGRTVEKSYDRLLFLIQRLRLDVERSLKFPLTDLPARDMPAKALMALQGLFFDASGEAIPTGGLTTIPISTAMQPVVTALTLALARAELETYSKAEHDADIDDLAAVYLGISAKAADSDKLDDLDYLSFLRRDISNSIVDYTKTISFPSNSVLNTASGGQSSLQVLHGSGGDAFMTFHSSGAHAFHFGLDVSRNALCIGGWSMGAVSYQIWHEGNDGSGSGLDADKLDGRHASELEWQKVADPGTGWLASKAAGWTGDQFTPGGLEVDFSAVVPAGTKAVRIVVYLLNVAGAVYWRKAGDANISNTPNASVERSHLVGYSSQDAWMHQVDVWLSSDYKVQFAIVNGQPSVNISYPVEYII